jgi:hypothetical protein
MSTRLTVKLAAFVLQEALPYLPHRYFAGVDETALQPSCFQPHSQGKKDQQSTLQTRVLARSNRKSRKNKLYQLCWPLGFSRKNWDVVKPFTNLVYLRGNWRNPMQHRNMRHRRARPRNESRTHKRRQERKHTLHFHRIRDRSAVSCAFLQRPPARVGVY